MPTKDELQARVDKRDAMLDACRAERTQMALKITDLEGRLAECEGTATPPDPPPEPPPPPPSGARTEWSPINATAAPGKGDFPSLDKKNVGLLDAAILTTKTGFTPAPGATYANLDIKNSFDTATGSTFRNCRVTASGYWAVLDRGGAAATYEDCEFVGNPGGDACCNLNGSTYRRCYLHGSEDGAKIDAGTMIDCLLIDNKSSLSNAHYDGLQSMGGGPIKIRHCYIGVPDVSGGTSAFLVKSDFSPIDNVVVEYCYLRGRSWTFDVCDGGHGFPTNVHLRYNRFGRAVFGAWPNRGPFEKVGNVWDDTGAALTTGT